jgi:hypothetical protein
VVRCTLPTAPGFRCARPSVATGGDASTRLVRVTAGADVTASLPGSSFALASVRSRRATTFAAVYGCRQWSVPPAVRCQRRPSLQVAATCAHAIMSVSHLGSVQIPYWISVAVSMLFLIVCVCGSAVANVGVFIDRCRRSALRLLQTESGAPPT